MTPHEFILKWQGSTLNERQSYQAHFFDLCALVGVDAPNPATADSYCFERGITKTGSRHGWADVWKRGFFAIEYKAPERNLDAGLLPGKMFERLLDKSQHESAKLSTRLAALFASMQKGGDFGADDIAWFNGGLYATPGCKRCRIKIRPTKTHPDQPLQCPSRLAGQCPQGA